MAKHEHDFKARVAGCELAFYECSCGETRPSSWRGDLK